MNRQSHRAIAAIGILCVLGIGTAAVSLRVRQHLIRVHAQRTINEIQYVEIGALGTCQIFSEWQKEWKSHLTSEGTCDDPNHFYMGINVQNPPNVWPCFEGQLGDVRFLLARATCGVYEVLSGRPVVFAARIEGVHGIVTRKVSQVFTTVPDESPDEHMPALMSATAMASTQFGNERKRQSDIRQQSLHPNYLVSVGTSRVNADYMPGARAFYIETEVGPDANKAESERLFRLDLSCLTRMRPCSRQDLMPAVYDQYEIDVKQLATLPQQ